MPGPVFRGDLGGLGQSLARVFWERLPPCPGIGDECSRLRTTALDGRASWLAETESVCRGGPCCTCRVIPFIVHSEILVEHWSRRKPCAPHMGWEGSGLGSVPAVSVFVALQGPHYLTIWPVRFSCMVITCVFLAAGCLLM